MRIKICIDIWRDVFDFLPPSDRKQIAQKSNRINDREFSDLLQKWLHEWTKNVRLYPIVIICSSHQKFPEVEMPDNIRDFTKIHISYLDSTVTSFLQRMQPLFHDKVNLDVQNFRQPHGFETMSTALDHLIPLLDGRINTIRLCHANLLFTIRDRFPAQFYGVKVFYLWFGFDKPTAELAELLLEWLLTPREDSQPRMLTLTLHAYNYAVWVLGLIERIRQQVINANNSPANFLLICIGFFGNIQESTTHNSGNNEQLVIRKRNEGGHLLIGRCPSDVDGQKWVEEMAQEACETEEQAGRRKISISDPKLGPFEEAELEEKEKFEEDGQPGPSKQKQ